MLFPFLRLFRGFRVAIHPSKLLLAMAFLLVVYGFGRGADLVWPRVFCHDGNDAGLFVLPTEYVPSGRDVYSSSTVVGPFECLLRYSSGAVGQVTDGVLGLSPQIVVNGVSRFVFSGPMWMFRYHPLFGAMLLSVVLLAWSIFGGAIARIAAIHVTRDEKISLRQALRFSTGKVLSFLSAPLIPLGLGALLFTSLVVGGMTYYIPWVGPIVLGALFFVAAGVALVVTLIVLGTTAGFPLMYPTIAVEGSDAFDAISRSFSYIFARPWRTLAYAAMSLVYGVLCYSFLKLFIFLLLWLIHTGQSLALTTAYAESFNRFFAAPRPDDLTASVPFSSMTPPEKIGAGFLSFWYYLVVAILPAFAISFYFSASTIIYTLLRYEVDVTELDEVHLEPADDELADLDARSEGEKPVEVVPVSPDDLPASATDAAPSPTGPQAGV